MALLKVGECKELDRVHFLLSRRGERALLALTNLSSLAHATAAAGMHWFCRQGTGSPNPIRLPALTSHRLPRGYEAERSNGRLYWLQLDPAQPGSWQSRPLDALSQADGVVNLAGEPIAEQRWTRTHLKLLESSRLETTRLLVEAMAALTAPPRCWSMLRHRFLRHQSRSLLPGVQRRRFRFPGLIV